MGYVNKFNRGIAKVKTELMKNGNPAPTFDYNKQTEFRVTLCPALFPLSGEINGEIKLIQAIAAHPGIKREGLLLATKIPLRSIDRLLRRLTLSGTGRIEYRGSKKTGGWYVKS